MSTTSNHQNFASLDRVSHSLSNDRCQNILYKAVFEHFTEIKWIAALLLTSKSFQNSSFGANFIVNFRVDDDSILLLESILFPSSCFSLQFAPSLHIRQSKSDPEKVQRGITSFVRELINMKYFRLSLRSLTLHSVTNNVVALFFGTCSTSWPQLQAMTLKHCGVNDTVLELISASAVQQLRAVNLVNNSEITDLGLKHLSELSNITSLDLCECNVSDSGLEHLATLSRISSLDLSGCGSITVDGLTHLSKLSGITSLGLSWCKNITDAGLMHISKLDNIITLDVSGCRGITAVGVEHISKLSRITVLDLSYCLGIDDACLEHISKLASITSLDLDGCDKITDNAKRNLRKSLPNCTIIDSSFQ